MNAQATFSGLLYTTSLNRTNRRRYSGDRDCYRCPTIYSPFLPFDAIRPQVLAGYLVTQVESTSPRLTCMQRCDRVVKFLQMISEQKQNVGTLHPAIKTVRSLFPFLPTSWERGQWLVRSDPGKETQPAQAGNLQTMRGANLNLI